MDEAGCRLTIIPYQPKETAFHFKLGCKPYSVFKSVSRLDYWRALPAHRNLPTPVKGIACCRAMWGLN